MNLRPLISLLLICVLAASIFGLGSMLFSPHMGGLALCPLMTEHNTFCAMSVGNHLAAWRGVFAGLAVSGVLTAVLMFVASARRVSTVVNDRAHDRLLRPHSLNRHPDIRLCLFLLSLFSSGILHPKIDA